jgi:hypothetical protein
MPVRIAAPGRVGGLTDNLLLPSSSTAIGLLAWGARTVMSVEPAPYESAPAGGFFSRMREALRSVFP